MRYLVRFERPVTYQPDHPVARRDLTELEVEAPDGQAAIRHAIRTTTGDPGAITAHPVASQEGA